MDIVWGGILGPDPSGCEVTLVDNGTDWGVRINAADVALGAKAGAICCQGGGNIASQIILNVGASSLRTLRFGAGTWTNSVPQLVIDDGAVTIQPYDNVLIEGHGWDTILQEAPGNLDLSYFLIRPVNAAGQRSNISVRNIQLSGVGINKLPNVTTATMNTGLLRGGTYENIWFNKTHAIGLTIGESSSPPEGGGPVCEGVVVRGCKFTNVGGGIPPEYQGGGGVTLAIINANNLLIDNCQFIDGLGNAVIDFEPNQIVDPITNITISNCLISQELTTGNCETFMYGIVIHTQGLTSYRQTGTVAVCARGAYCSPLALSAGTGTQHAELQAIFGAPIGTSTSTLGLAANQTTVIGISYEIAVGDVIGQQWYAGTWTIRLNITAANANITWTNVDICRVSSGCVSQATIGSASGLGISLGTTGVKTATVTGSAQTPSAGDKVIILLGFTNSAASAQTVVIINDQLIDSPFRPPVGPIKIIGCALRGNYGRGGGNAGEVAPTGHLYGAIYVNYGSTGGQSYNVTAENNTIQACSSFPFIADVANDNVFKNNTATMMGDDVVTSGLRNVISGNSLVTTGNQGSTFNGIHEGPGGDYNSLLNNTVVKASTILGTHSVISGETVISRPSFTPVYSPLPSGTVMTTNANDVILAIAQEAGHLSILAPFTALQNTNQPAQLGSVRFAPGYQLATSAGAYPATWTNTETAQWLVAMLALKGSASLVQQIDAGAQVAGLGLTPSTTGGTLATGTYYYRVVGIYHGGEFLSTEQSTSVTGPTGSVAITINVLNGPGFPSYKIYRGTASGVYTIYYTTTSLSFTDTGAAGTAGSPPTALAFTGTLGATPTNGNAVALTYCYQPNSRVHVDLSSASVGGIALTKGPTMISPWGVTAIWHVENIQGATNGIVTATLTANTVVDQDKVWFNASEWSGVLTTNAVDGQTTNSFPTTW